MKPNISKLVNILKSNKSVVAEVSKILIDEENSFISPFSALS